MDDTLKHWNVVLHAFCIIKCQLVKVEGALEKLYRAENSITTRIPPKLKYHDKKTTDNGTVKNASNMAKRFSALMKLFFSRNDDYRGILQKCPRNSFFAFTRYRTWRTRHKTSSLQVKMQLDENLEEETGYFSLSHWAIWLICFTLLDGSTCKSQLRLNFHHFYLGKTRDTLNDMDQD